MALEDQQDQHATVFKGQDAVLRFTIAEDVTGWEFDYVIRALNGSGSALVTKTEADMSITAGATSTVDVSLSASNLNITAKVYAHSLWRTNTGNVEPLAVGELRVLPSSYAP